MPWEWITNYLRDIIFPCLANVHKNAFWIDSSYWVIQEYKTFPFLKMTIETSFFSLGCVFSIEEGK